MLFNYILGIYCFHCKKYYSPYTEVFINVLGEGTITCNKDHILGYTHDLEWKKFWGEE